jgi:hypothetical protein
MITNGPEINTKSSSNSLRAGKNRFVQPQNRSVRDIAGSVRTKIVSCGHFPIRAGQFSVRAGKNQSVRPFFDLCGQKPDLWAVLALAGGQKATVEANW